MCAFLLLLAFTCTSAFAALPAYTVKNLPTGAGAIATFAADFNHDGKADIATLGSGGVSVLLGNGDGTFGAPITTSTGGTPVWWSIGDLNGDGIPDIAVTNSGATPAISILIGRGDGTFRVAPSPGAGMVGAFGDFNGDGKMDLAVARSGRVVILSGNGDGTFTTGADVTPTGTFAAEDLIGGDFNGDGKADIAFTDCCDPTIEAAPVGKLHVLFNNGSGTFTDWSTGASGPLGLAAFDLNKDGLTDLGMPYAGCHTPCVGGALFFGNRNSTMTASSGSFGVPDFNNTRPSIPAAADFDGDGTNDVAYAANWSPPNNFTSQPEAVFIVTGPSFTGQPTSIDVGPQNPNAIKSVATADFDRDGKPDIAVTSGAATVAVLLSGNASSGGGGASNADFGLGVTPTSLTVTAGKSGILTAVVTPSGGFNSQVSFSCSGLPTGATCTFNPATVTPSGSAAVSTTLTIATTGTSAALRDPFRLSVWFAILPIGGVLIGTGRSRKKMLLLLLVALLALLTLQACGGSSSSSGSGNNGGTSGNSGGGSGSTPTGNYTVSVNATGGGQTHSTNVALTVQ